MLRVPVHCRNIWQSPREAWISPGQEQGEKQTSPRHSELAFCRLLGRGKHHKSC